MLAARAASISGWRIARGRHPEVP